MEAAEVERVRAELVSRGFAVCRNLLPAETIARARGHLEKCVDRHIEQAVAASTLDDACEGLSLEQRMVAAYSAKPDEAPCSWVPQTRTSFVFQQLLFRDPALCQLVSALTDGRQAEVASRYNCRCKLPAASGASFPWHQDHAFFRMQYILKKEHPKRLLAAWAPLVHVDATNGGVELCPGSHRLGFLRHGRHSGFLAIAPGGTLPEDAAAEDCELPTLEPGDVMLFTDLTLHRSGLNQSDAARWSADWAYELRESDPITPALEPPVAGREPAAIGGALPPASAHPGPAPPPPLSGQEGCGEDSGSRTALCIGLVGAPLPRRSARQVAIGATILFGMLALPNLLRRLCCRLRT